MAQEFTPQGFLFRWLLSFLLVVLTYNPTDYSYVSWLFSESFSFGPVPILAGLVLLIGWIIFARATLLSLGWLGITLGAAVFVVLIWLLVDLGWISVKSTGVITWLTLIVISLILAVGLSWSHIRRRLTGQFDVDDMDD